MSVCRSCGAMRLEQWTCCPFCRFQAEPAMPESIREAPAPLVAAIALVVVLLFGALGFLLRGGGDAGPENLAMINETPVQTSAGPLEVDQDAVPSDATAPGTDVASEPSVPPGPTLNADLAPQFRAICAGKQATIPGAAAPTVAAFNDVITVAFDTTTGVWSDPSTEVAYSSAVPPLVRCDTTTDAGPIYFCDDYEEGFSYTGLATDWSTRVIQTIDGAVIAEAGGRNENVADCPDTLTVYDDNKTIVVRAGADPTAPAAIALFPTSASFACTPHTEPNGLLAFAANDPAQTVPIPDTWPSTPNSLGATTLCLDQRAEVGDDELCRTIVAATAFDPVGNLLGAWSYTHGSCDWTSGPSLPPIEWFRNIVGPALGYPPA